MVETQCSAFSTASGGVITWSLVIHAFPPNQTGKSTVAVQSLLVLVISANTRQAARPVRAARTTWEAFISFYSRGVWDAA